MDLSGLSLAELQTLTAQIEAQLARLAKRERAAAMEQIYAIATGLGMPLSELMRATRKAAVSAPATGKTYRDPANPGNEWRGRGPRPKWLKAALASGTSLDSLSA